MAGVIAYVGLFNGCYIYLVSPVYGYFGMMYEPPGPEWLLLAWLLAVSPAFWMPTTLTRPTQFIYWTLYVAVFIPSAFVPFYIGIRPPQDALALVVTLWVSMALLGTIYRWPLLRLPGYRLPPSWFWMLVGGFSVAFYFVYLILARNHLRIVSLQEMYVQRFALQEAGIGGPILYAIWAQKLVFNPLFLIVGLLTRRPSLVVISIVGQVILYAGAAEKTVLMSLVALPVLAWMIRDRGRHIGAKITWGLSALFGSIALIQVAGLQFLALVLTLVILFRTFAIPGLLSGLYQDFFLEHSQTLFSQVKGFNLLSAYPYDDTIPRVIGFYYYGNDRLNANAHLWADGFASWGYAGILVVTLITMVVLWLADSVALDLDIRLTTLFYGMFGIALANNSLFTNLLTNGLALSILLVYLMPRTLLHRAQRAPQREPGKFPPGRLRPAGADSGGG